MKAARQRPIAAPAPRPPATVRMVQPPVDDPATVDRVVSILAELLARRRKR